MERRDVSVNISFLSLMYQYTINFVVRFFDIPMESLAEIKSSSEVYGYMTDGLLKGVPISGVKMHDIKVIVIYISTVLRRSTSCFGRSMLLQTRRS